MRFFFNAFLAGLWGVYTILFFTGAAVADAFMAGLMALCIFMNSLHDALEVMPGKRKDA